MAKKWEIRKPISKSAAEKLATYPVFLRDLLAARGLTKLAEAEKYLHPSYERDLHDPFLMKGMKKAVERINKAITDNEKIIIYGDYDADGVPGVVIITAFFKEIGFTNFDIFIPDRQLDGYGLKDDTIVALAKDGAKLIITVDCGIGDVVPAKKAKELGMEMIITDHHLPQNKLPKVVAILDNKQSDDKYPDKMLCGASMAFKLVQALSQKNSHSFKIGWEKWLLDLVAIATISDMVPLDGENRLLAYFGLKVLRKTRRVGLLELFRTMKIQRDNVTEDDIGFMLAPRLNAASRMSHAVQSYFLLTTDDADQARDIVKHLEEKNKERKAMVEHIVTVIEERLKEDKELPAVLVFGDPTWQAGGLGLVANKLKDKYGKSAFIWGGNGATGEFKGSARSDGQVNLVKLMEAAGGEKFFANFGGHFMAAGFAVAEAKMSELATRLNQAYKKLATEKYQEEVLVDKEISLDDITWENYYFIEEMGPYGMGNPKPIFMLKGVMIDAVKAFGSGGIHLELVFRNTKDKKIPAIGFFTCLPAVALAKEGTPAEKFDTLNGHIFKGVNLEVGQKIDALVTIEKSTFRNFPELRLRIVDIRHIK
jgi:single-stranded-DNA-specific exonuclease